MRKIKMSKQAVNVLVKEGLMHIGYPNNLKIESFITTNNKVAHQLYYEAEIGGINEKFIKKLKNKDYYNILKHIMNIKGYNASFINPLIENDDISYEVTYHIEEYKNMSLTKQRNN